MIAPTLTTDSTSLNSHFQEEILQHKNYVDLLELITKEPNYQKVLRIIDTTEYTASHTLENGQSLQFNDKDLTPIGILKLAIRSLKYQNFTLFFRQTQQLPPSAPPKNYRPWLTDFILPLKYFIEASLNRPIAPSNKALYNLITQRYAVSMNGPYSRDFTKSLPQNIDGGKHLHKYTEIIAIIIKPTWDKENKKFRFPWLEFLIALCQESDYYAVEITADILNNYS